MSHTSQPVDEEETAGVSPLGIDIEHIADSNTWAEQAWRLIRERREHERKEVEERERARLEEQQRRRRDEKDWRERQAALSQQRAAAIDTADLPSSSAHRRARTAGRERREKEEAGSSADVQAGAMSGWQQRGLLHVWTSEGGREQEDRERREIWEGNMRGKRSQLEKMEADRRKHNADKPAAGRANTQQRRPHTAAPAYRTATTAVKPRSAWTARARDMSPPPPAMRPLARPCIRCALPSTSFMQVALVALVAEHEHLSRLLPSSSVVVPSAVSRMWPELSAEQYRVRCGDSSWLARQVDVCHECAEWLDDNKHVTARRQPHQHNEQGSSSGSAQRQQYKSSNHNGASDDDSETDSSEEHDSVRSITQLVNRLLATSVPSHPPLG